jgi:hypothetical protein
MMKGLKGYFSRPQFRWKDADEIYIGAGSYHLYGTSIPNSVVYWDSEITFQLGSGGSNALSDNLGASAWHYIYIDESAVVGLNTNLLTAACFLNDTTAPAWSESYHGWYNGNDRCIFAVLTDGSNNVLNFYHDGEDFVHHNAYFAEAVTATPSNVFTDVNMASSVPAFSTRALVNVILTYVDTAISLMVRPNGSSSTAHKYAGEVAAGSTISVNEVIVYLDTGQIFEVAFAVPTVGNTVTVLSNGWYLPRGM